MNPVSGLAACIGKAGLLAAILRQIKHRARAGYIHYTERDALLSESTHHPGDGGVAACLRFRAEPPKIPLHGGFYEPKDFNLDRLGSLLLEGRFDGALEVLKGSDGAYALVINDGYRLILVRDPLGQKPLYYTKHLGFIAAASERNALERLGYASKEVPPASIIVLSGKEEWVYKFSIKPSGVEVRVLDEAAKTVLSLLERSVEARLSVCGETLLGFSGGVDSALLSKLASSVGQVRLVCIGLEGSKDLKWGMKAAEMLGLDVEALIVSIKSVESTAAMLKDMYGHLSPLDLSIAVGVRLMAEHASARGSSTLTLGQLADELFGGYKRYQRAYTTLGPDHVHRLIVNDVIEACKGFERDENASAPNVELILPYASKDLVEYVLKIDPRLKVSAEQRKIVLRRAAELLSLPEEIIEAPKKALQYSTGIYKVVRRLYQR